MRNKENDIKDILISPQIAINKKIRAYRNKRDISIFLKNLILFLLITGFFMNFIFGIIAMPDESMKPTFRAGDLILYYRLADNFSEDDIVVYTVDGQEYIGRIKARPGDKITVTEDRRVVVNGNNIFENDIYYETAPYEDGIEYPINLSRDEYFILADFREGSIDSRKFGAVKKENIKGSMVSAMRRSG